MFVCFTAEAAKVWGMRHLLGYATRLLFCHASVYTSQLQIAQGNSTFSYLWSKEG